MRTRGVSLSSLPSTSACRPPATCIGHIACGAAACMFDGIVLCLLLRVSDPETKPSVTGEVMLELDVGTIDPKAGLLVREPGGANGFCCTALDCGMGMPPLKLDRPDKEPTKEPILVRLPMMAEAGAPALAVSGMGIGGLLNAELSLSDPNAAAESPTAGPWLFGVEVGEETITPIGTPCSNMNLVAFISDSSIASWAMLIFAISSRMLLISVSAFWRDRLLVSSIDVISLCFVSQQECSV